MTMPCVIGGSNADIANPRTLALHRAMAQRSFSAVLDDGCLDALP